MPEKVRYATNGEPGLTHTMPLVCTRKTPESLSVHEKSKVAMKACTWQFCGARGRTHPKPWSPVLTRELGTLDRDMKNLVRKWNCIAQICA